RPVAEERRLPGAGAQEGAARCNLCGRTVVHEHELSVDARVLTEVVVREHSSRVALIGALVVIRRREVVLIVRREGAQLAIGADREVAVAGPVGRITAAYDEARWRCRTRTTAA